MMLKPFWPLLLLTVICLPPYPVAAQTLSLLHSFPDGPAITGSVAPNGLVLGTDGNFYGTTAYDGTAGNGTVLQITPGGAETVLHDFGDGTVQNDGANPFAALALGSDGDFYGTTSGGGAAFDGTVFQVTPTGAVTILHSFNDGTVLDDGVSPQAALVLGDDGNFYGTTSYGGTTMELGAAGSGTAFQITPFGTETVLHDFADGSVANDGATPVAALVIGSDGDFYGTTPSGGTDDAGTVFKLSPSGTETVLHSFHDGTVANDGFEPYAALILGGDGDFYGTASAGGPVNGGTVFKITPSGAETILHDFGDATVANDGYSPDSSLALGADGDFYGTANVGGSANQGAIFKMTPAGTVTILHSFGDGSVAQDGINPQTALVLDTDGSFYGTTDFGGATDQGAVFRLALSGAAPLTWSSRNVAAASDGTARLLWIRSDGAARLGIFSAANVLAATGPTYGPYGESQGAWTARVVKVAGDGTARLLWTRSDGAAGVWTLDASGTQINVGPVYGPYAGWKAVDLATAPNGVSRVLWANTSGAAGLWTFSAADAATLEGAAYGPYAGWTASAVGAAADGTARILWNRSDGAAGLWTLNAADAVQAIGPVYGPYSDGGGTWSASGLATSADGQSQALWTRSDGAAGLWTLSAADLQTGVGPVYGPYSGFTASALDTTHCKARVLWVRSDQAAGLWSFATDDVVSVIGSVYGPF